MHPSAVSAFDEGRSAEGFICHVVAWLAVIALNLAAFSLFRAEFGEPAPKPGLLVMIGSTLFSGLMLKPTLAHNEKPATLAKWTLSLSLALLLSVAVYYPHSDTLKLAGRAATALFLFAFFIFQVDETLSRRFSDYLHVPLTVLIGVISITALPVWIAPWVEAIALNPPALTTILACSPLTFFATVLDYDYLRSEWFYRNTPYGMLRYAYPNPIWTGIMFALFPIYRIALKNRLQAVGSYKHQEVMLMLFNKILPVALFASLLFPVVGNAEPSMNPELQGRGKRAIDAGLHYLRGSQEVNGSWSNSVGITAIAVRAFLESPRKYNEDDGPFITKPIKFILSHVKSNGAISESIQNLNYNTAVAITALKATNNPAYDEVIRNGQKFITGLQLDEQKEYDPKHKYYGGIGYGGDERPDLSNQYIALEALKATQLDPKDPVWQRALAFINRTQNNSESNDQSWAKNDGGFTYMPGYSPNGETNSYGGMTHAGLISLLFAGVDKADPRVVAAYNWIRNNYTLDTNPGALKNQGLFYYYNAFAKSMFAYGEAEITDGNGVVHNWRDDLVNKLLSLQDAEGYWVNSNARWWENDKNLVTGWSVVALNYAVR